LGLHAFFTSSQDCSFLFIDGRLVVAAPGQHGPSWDARFKGSVNLSAGRHTFEYLHAAAGRETCVVAAWQPPGGKGIEVIPASVFGAGDVVEVLPSVPSHRLHGILPDFALESLGEVPLADSDVPMVRVQLLDLSSRPRKARWDFGDGSSAEAVDPMHVYLRPGLYTIQMTSQDGLKVVTAKNRVQVYRPLIAPDAKKRPDTLRAYLPLLSHFDSTRLGPGSALQLVRACEQAGQAARAGNIGKAALLSAQAGTDAEAAYALAQEAGQLLRDRLDDPVSAWRIWQTAAGLISRPDARARCELEAAEILLHDLDKRGDAKAALERATAVLRKAGSPALQSRQYLLWGDLQACGAKRAAAREAYEEARLALGKRGSSVEENAWLGAMSRSTEAFLRDGELSRARDELRRWEQEFPECRVEGYWSLLQARYLVARGKFQQAIGVAGNLAIVNPDSPYADRLAFLAAECEEKLGQAERARAAFRAFLTDHPGSPLVADAKRKLASPVKETPKPSGKAKKGGLS